MKRIKFLLIIILSGTLPVSCIKNDDPDPVQTYSILVNNSSNNDVLAFYQLNYPDTALQQIKPEITWVRSKSYGLMQNTKKWDELIKQNPRETLWVFFLAAGSFEQYSWDSIRSRYLVLKRMGLPLDSLQKMNWTIQY